MLSFSISLSSNKNKFSLVNLNEVIIQVVRFYYFFKMHLQRINIILYIKKKTRKAASVMSGPKLLS
jgi:hypothetical protein